MYKYNNKENGNNEHLVRNSKRNAMNRISYAKENLSSGNIWEHILK